jgi:hypothetical protein
MLALINAFAGLILGFMAGGALTEAALKLVPERALRAPATAAGVLVMWSSALLGALAGWSW